MNRTLHRFLWIAFALFVAAPFVLVCLGSGARNLLDLFSPAFRSSLSGVVFWDVRVPRLCLGFAAGGALALAGLVFQAVFRNPLATPFTLGVSSGAACGAALAVKAGLDFTIAGFSALPVFAFFGAAVTIFLVFALAGIGRDYSTESLLLCGIALSFFFSAVIMFVQYLSDFTGSFQLVRWLMGDLNVVGYAKPLELCGLVVAAGVPALALSRNLNLLLAGDEIAHSRGVSVTRTRFILLGAVSLMTGGVVALCGPIGFVGMMVPQMVRMVAGSDHVRLIPYSLLGGGAFLAMCDWTARAIIPPAEIPVGILTSLLGGPFFLYLLLKTRKNRM